MMNLRAAKILSIVLYAACSISYAFEGLASTKLQPVEEDKWGLKIVIFDIGRADATLLLTPNGDSAVIDAGRKDVAQKIAALLPDKNGVKTIDLMYITHYDADHIRGVHKFSKNNAIVKKVFDQGHGERILKTGTGKPSVYAKYAEAVGDLNKNGQKDANEPNFIRNKAQFAHTASIGASGKAQIHVVAVNGDTARDQYDIDLDPEGKPKGFNENPGSIALLIQFGEFEYYTAGDQTCDTENRMLKSGAIRFYSDDEDIDVLKISHHGSDTSTGRMLVARLRPEVSIVPSDKKFAKKDVLKRLENIRSYVLVTGEAKKTSSAIYDQLGDVTILVSQDGTRYTVNTTKNAGTKFSRTFSSLDSSNAPDRSDSVNGAGQYASSADECHKL